MIWEGLQVPTLDGFTGFVPPQGDGTSHVMIMGEAPGEHEAKDSIPFHPKAPAGSTLDRLLRRAGLEREKFVVANTVWSRPPNNYLEGSAVEGQAIAAFAPFRDRAFELYRPRVIVAMGGVALRALTAWGGKGAGISQCQGYLLDGPWDGTFVVPALHPSAILRGEQRMSGVVIWALQRAIEIARTGFTRSATRYIAHPSLDDALTFERGYDPTRHILSYDIETPESSNIDEEEVEDKDEDISYNIIRISFCYLGDTGYAISLPWQPPYVDIARRLLSSAGPKRVWNGNFDNPRLAAANAPVRGRNYDSMWAWKHLQPTLPRSLGFVAPFYNWSWEPWKNTSLAEPEVYSCKDAHALQLIGDGVDAHLKQKGQWEVYERHVVELSEVLTTMSRNGLPYSKEKAAAFELELQAKWDERFAELQRVVPDELKPSKQKSGYKRAPADLTGLVNREFNILGLDFTEEERSLTMQPVIVDHQVYRVNRWCKLEPFLPTSTQQVQALLKFHGLPVGKNRKTKNDSADDEHLRKMIKRTRGVKKHAQLTATLQMIRECKQLSKVLGTYVKGWRPGSDGRIHATYGFWGRMFRISARRPNVCATVQDKQDMQNDLDITVARGFRKCVTARSGHVLLEADWKSMESVLVAYYAGDHDYDRLARLGVHDYMTCYILADRGKMNGTTLPDLSWSDSDLKHLFHDVKDRYPKDRDDAKHCIHGISYGMTAFLMADMYNMSRTEAQRLIDMFFTLFPKVKAWQKSVLDRASRECKLVNPFTYSMPLWEVYRWDSKRQIWALGEDAKAAIAFLPRDTGAAMLKELLLRLDKRHDLVNQGIVLTPTHDSVLSEPEERDMERIARILHAEMTAPVPELGGLVIPCTLKYGSSWHDDEMETLELPQAVLASA